MNRKLLFTGVALLLAANCGFAATKIGAIGTTQMAGEWAAFNKPYSLGAKGDKMNITLKSAEYTVGIINIGTESYFPKNGEKLLVLRYTIHNPEKQLNRASWSTFKFTAVDAEDANHSYMLKIGQETNNKELSMNLKPAQKVEAYAVIRVGANGEVPKLIVQRGPGMILRYDLRGKVKPLSAEYADPSDPTGATLLAEVNGALGKYYHAGNFDFKVDSVNVVAEPVGGKKPGKGKSFAVVLFTIKNVAAVERSYVWSVLKPSMDTDSGAAKWNSGYVDAKSLESVSSVRVRPGQEESLGFILEVKADAKPESVTFETQSDMLYKFDLKGSE